jgi:hypothetical protein
MQALAWPPAARLLPYDGRRGLGRAKSLVLFKIARCMARATAGSSPMRPVPCAGVRLR